jgi:organic radical activating enzyme
MLDDYTSTGKKLLKHPTRLFNYINGKPQTIISSHISPTADCNNDCDYCSFGKRDKKEYIPFHVIDNYLTKVYEFGCKAITLTGGGEPMIYPKIQLVIDNILYYGMQLGIITNGYHLQNTLEQPFKWIRISFNNNPEFLSTIVNTIPPRKKGTIGFSMIMTKSNMQITPDFIKSMMKKYDAKYIRLVPDCVLNEERRNKSYVQIIKWLGSYYNDQSFIIQYKKLIAPISKICHQSYFRPYLSEFEGGTVFACDCMGLNNGIRRFDRKYALCKAEDIEDYMNKNIVQAFDSSIDCSNCAYSKTNNMLEEIYLNKKFNICEDNIDHINFV